MTERNVLKNNTVLNRKAGVGMSGIGGNLSLHDPNSESKVLLLILNYAKDGNQLDTVRLKSKVVCCIYSDYKLTKFTNL